MDGLRFNKIAAAVLATALGIVGLRELSSVVYAQHPAEKPGWAIEVVEETPEAAAELPPDWGTVLPVADVKAGEGVSAKCVSCHSFAAGGPNGTGPDLYSIVNRKPGTHGGFAYSAAMVAHGNEAPQWTYEELDEYLAAPQKHVKGTKMTFVGLKKQQDRINIIAWLRTLSPAPAPIPAPNPAAAASAAPAAGVPAAGTAAADQPVAAPPETPAGNTAAGGPAGGAATTGPAAQASSTKN